MAFNYFPYPSLTDYAYQGFDTADASFTPAQMVIAASNGVRFVGRYLTEAFKVTRAECLNWLTAGIAMYFYVETRSDDALRGYNYGYEQGKAAQAAIQNIGVPNGTMIFCCCDMDVTDAQARTVVADYYRGFKAAIPFHRVGIYGGANVVSAVKELYPTVCYTAQAGAWGYNKELRLVDVRQWEWADRCVPYIRISGVTYSGAGYSWRGKNVDMNSAATLDFMWTSKDQPRPTPYTPPDNPPSISTPLDGICGNGATDRYHKLSDCPTWAQPVLEKLLKSGKLKGVSTDSQDLDLSLDMIRLLTIIYREGET